MRWQRSKSQQELHCKGKKTQPWFTLLKNREKATLRCSMCDIQSLLSLLSTVFPTIYNLSGVVKDTGGVSGLECSQNPSDMTHILREHRTNLSPPACFIILLHLDNVSQQHRNICLLFALPLGYGLSKTKLETSLSAMASMLLQQNACNYNSMWCNTLSPSLAGSAPA